MYEYFNKRSENKKEYLKIDKYNLERYHYLSVLLRERYHVSNKGLFNHITDIIKNYFFSEISQDMKTLINMSNSVASIFLKLESIDSDEKTEKTYYIVKKIVFCAKNFQKMSCIPYAVCI